MAQARLLPATMGHRRDLHTPKVGASRVTRQGSPQNEQADGDRRPGVTGGDEGDRTLDLRIANAALSQLSYVPTGPQV
jgi:hypothetical protein